MYTVHVLHTYINNCDAVGYSYAPVLLNARAIIKCKANLNTFSFPVIFLFLEGSCMRQLRNIFGLTSNEFSPTSNGKVDGLNFLSLRCTICSTFCNVVK